MYLCTCSDFKRAAISQSQDNAVDSLHREIQTGSADLVVNSGSRNGYLVPVVRLYKFLADVANVRLKQAIK